MLQRALEPEVMDSDDEARDYDAMDHVDVNRRFVDDFLAFYMPPGPVLDVGTGTAQIPLELAQRAPTLQIEGVDASAAMLRLAQQNIDRAGVADRIRVLAADAKRLPHGDRSFAAVISNSIVHHIPEPRAVLAEMIRVTARGGVLFVRDLLRPESDAAVRALVEQYASGANAHQRAMFDASLRAALSLAEIREMASQLGMNPAEVTQTSDRHWTWAARKQGSLSATRVFERSSKTRVADNDPLTS